MQKILNHDRMNQGRFSTDSEYQRDKSCKSEKSCLKIQVNKKWELQQDSESPEKVQKGDKRMAEKDIQEKILMTYSDVFADCENALAYGGRKRLKEEELYPAPTEKLSI